MKKILAFLVCLAAAAPALAQQPCPCPEKKEPPPPAFTGNVGLGYGVSSGNTDSSTFSLTLGLKYDPKTNNVVKFGGYYLWGQADGVTNQEKANVVLRDEYSFSERLFAYGEVPYLHDKFKGISYQIAPTAGLGYKVVKTEAVTFAVDGGAGAVIEKNYGFDTRTSGAFRFGESFEWKATAWAKLTENAFGRWRMDDTSDYDFHVDLGLSSPLSKILEVRLAYVYDYKSKPVPETLKKGDTSFLASIGAKF